MVKEEKKKIEMEAEVDLGQTGFWEERLGRLPPPGEADLLRRRTIKYWIVSLFGLVILVVGLGLLSKVVKREGVPVVVEASPSPFPTFAPTNEEPEMLKQVREKMEKLALEDWMVEPPPVEMDITF